MKTKAEKEILIARVESLKNEMSQIKKENLPLLDGSQPIDEASKNKINIELLKRQNEILKLRNVIKDGSDESEVDLNKVKTLIHDRGLKDQVNQILSKDKMSFDAQINRSITIDCSDCITDCTECVTNCTDCLHCDTDCVSGCTTCISCVSEEVTGNLPV